MNKKQKSHIRPIVYVMISVFLIIGYAYLTSSLTINGASLLKKATWDVHFENVQVADGSVTGEQVIDEPEIDSEQTTVTFHVNLKKPGDYYEFTVDAVNAGTIDAMINSYTEFDLTENQLKYLETSVTYEDGEEIAEKQQLLAGDFAVYKIVVSFKKDLEADDLPSTPEQLDLEFTVEYIQKDDTAIERLAETNSLYNVLKRETENGGLALKYSGSHQDSMDASKSTRDIYHWYADNDTDGSTVTNKNNVIFANHCWQMFRTTDTGGVKLIYNGEVDNDQCLDTRGTHEGYSERNTQYMSSTYYYGTSYSFDKTNNTYSLSGNVTTGTIQIGQYTCKSTSASGTCTTLYYVDELSSGSDYYAISMVNNSPYSQFGKLQYNSQYLSPANLGYMYNTIYNYQYKTLTSAESMLATHSISTAYWYANSVAWGSPSSNRYNLNNPFQISSEAEYTNLVGKYTFANTSQNYVSTTVYYIVAVEDSTMYYLELEYNGNHQLSDYNYTYTYGSSYTDNGNGTYTINNPTTVYRSNWYTAYSSINEHDYVCKNATNNTCDELWYVIGISNRSMSYINVSNNYKYSKSFTWNGNKYILDNSNAVSFWNAKDSTNMLSLNNAHYTCWNSSGECTTLSFIYFLIDSTSGQLNLYYVDLNNGKSIEDAKNEMLYNQNVNSIDSTIKTGVELWFERYMLDYSYYLEDTIFCNNRSQINADTSGWNPNGGDLTKLMYLKELDLNNDLSCENVLDRFSTLNNKAQLKYKVGLITSPELNILNNANIRKTGNYYWSISPYVFMYYGSGHRIVISNGDNDQAYLTGSKNGVRPVISLKPGTIYTSGDGSKTNPYIINTN